ncbi:MAG: cystathionine gamma-synthase [Acidimicrobiia bacterium]|nr:cystathionine gamma-synthase [Acidimicrobiia bacterium]MDH4364426.1 cystathionine gamma-synthase [Acidimicrobiia bacterium]MDH5289259.1 cystathionine gamma-synthase [Acidimicrobiia bacterium]
MTDTGETSWGFATRAIHVGQDPETVTGAVTVPVFQTSTFAQEAVGKHSGYEYGRTGNPTRTALQRVLASLEDASFGVAFASGLAAEDAVLRLLEPGDHVVLGNDAYGGTFRLISRVFARTGITWSAHDLSAPAGIGDDWPAASRMVWVETPTNPLLTVVDIAVVAAVAARKGARLVVDNTFATPYLQRPLAHGADIVVHSTTKYLGGHSDVVGGFVATNDSEVHDHLAFIQNAVGAVPAPWDCYLTMRGVKTLPLRMDRHNVNAEAVVALLTGHPAVRQVLYPGLPGHPGHDAARRQMSGFGGMVSFRMGSRDAATRVIESTRLFTLAESLGAVESLIEHPGAMTHASAAGSPLEVPDDLVRLSVGIEDEADLVADLAQALDAVDPGR